ncbi:MAG: glycosyltransferase family 39 protein, partial [Bacteroidetes bacterium]|nr:glycosyltransferase family 39 protein [Bacteroidota bacterium]
MKLNKISLFSFSPKTYFIIILLLFIVSFIGLFIPIMEVDATQYASMSLELLQSNSLLQFTDLGKDYLDKPPLLFWVSSFFISLFGNTTIAYKMGSFILAWCSVYFLYRFVLLFYKKTTAQLASIIYAGNVAFVLFTNDIRTDTLLISFVVLAVWQYAQYLKTYKISSLILASVAVGLAMLAKGPIGLVVTALAIVPHIFLTSNYKAIFTWKVLLIPIIIIAVLSPMLLGLHQQFGMHGIRFYFWEQSFGRITGENVWQNDA